MRLCGKRFCLKNRLLRASVSPRLFCLFWLRLELAGAAGLKERLQQMAAFVLENAANDRAAMVEVGMIEKVELRAGRPARGIGHAEDDDGNAGQDNGPGAHRAGFLGDIKGRVQKAPVAERAGGLGDGDHFGVSGWILEQLDLVARAGDDAGRRVGRGRVAIDDDRAGRRLAGLRGRAGFAQGAAHGIVVGHGVVLDLKQGLRAET